MSLRIGIENGNEGRTIAWALDHPGCFSYGENSLVALRSLPASVQEYNEWLLQHGLDKSGVPVAELVQIVETWDVYHITEDYAISRDGYEVEAWFQDDWRPLNAGEIKLGIKLLTMSRKDLLSSVSGLTEDQLNSKSPGERWSIAGILTHVADAEWWYLDRLGSAHPLEQVSQEPIKRLTKVREHLFSVLPSLVDSSQVVGADGEFWSPRKLLRRALWHERDHTFHIRRLLSDKT